MYSTISKLSVKIQQAAKYVKTGGIVIYPTDTAYAIGCVFDNASGIQKIMKYKGRRDSKFTVIASSLRQVEKYFPLNLHQRKLARQYWPGPLSIVVSKHFAIRVPDQPIARSLARRAGKPLIATSFNKTGEPEVYNLDSYQVETLSYASLPEEFFILNIGRLPKRKPSTVVEYKNNELIVHRRGSITL